MLFINSRFVNFLINMNIKDKSWWSYLSGNWLNLDIFSKANTILVIKVNNEKHSLLEIFAREIRTTSVCWNIINTYYDSPYFNMAMISYKMKNNKNKAFCCKLSYGILFLGYASPEGPLISKCLFGVFNSSKQRMKTIRLEVPMEVSKE